MALCIKYFALHAFVFACFNQFPEAMMPDVLTCQSSLGKMLQRLTHCLFQVYSKELFFLLSKSLRNFSSALIDKYKMTSVPPASIATLSILLY